MFDRINASFEFHKQAIGLRDERQQVLANNISNADTPNFKARDIDFGSELSSAIGRINTSMASADMRLTSAGHIPLDGSSVMGNPDLLYRVPAQPSLDGNTVDMDRERTEFMDNSVRYQASLVLINSYIQGLKSAIQPE